MKQPESKPFIDVSATELNALPVYPVLAEDHVATGRTNRSCVYTLHTSCSPGKITQTNSQGGGNHSNVSIFALGLAVGACFWK